MARLDKNEGLGVRRDRVRPINLTLKEEDKYIITSESVSSGHPDKVCDLIADTILDAYLKEDPTSHVACEVVCTTQYVLILGEVTSKANIDVEKIARDVIVKIGYDKDELGFNGHTCKIDVRLNEQSPDIAMGVGDDEGAGDQGMMFGMATSETENYMPAPIHYAHALIKRLEYLRKEGNAKFLRPDAKSQISFEYKGNEIVRITNVILSTQHDESISLSELKDYVLENVIKYALPSKYLDEDTIYYINPTGRFVIGGPCGDSGLTGRKIIVDTYGGICHHGGGAFSGKDPSKVDRSASYLARYIAKNIVASGIIDKIEIGLSYAIGVAEPTSIMVDTFGLDFKYKDINKEALCKMIRKVFPLSPKAFIKHLDLRKPIYANTTNYGHFGKDGFSFEKLDKVEEIKEYFELLDR